MVVMNFKCKYSKYCGACKNLDKEFEAELKEKTEYVSQLFREYDADVCDCVGSYYPMKYRNKVHLAFAELKGKTIIGFFEEGSTRVTDIDNCLHYADWLPNLILILREYVSRFKIRPYKDGVGIIRYAHARCIDNKLQLTLVVTSDNFGGRDWLFEKLKSVYSEVSFYLNINRRTDRAIFDHKFRFIKGSKYLEFNMCGLRVSISPNSFLQVNLPIAEKMYKEAVAMLNITNKTTVLDLYSGIGITSIMFGKFAKEVFAIEEVSSAVENAKYMDRLNKTNNIHHLLGKCEDKINSLKLDDIEDLVVFLDPARAGVEKSLIGVLKGINPRTIVYMSCNPESCVRDINIITADKKYKLKDIKPYAMFPYTNHVELLTCLVK